MKTKIHFIYLLKIFISLAVLVSMFIYSQTVRETVRYSLKLCYDVVIPSLLPYITATSILTHYITCKIKGNLKNEKILLYSAIIISIMSGFPSGAITVCNLYRAGLISKRKAEILIGCFCNVSPAFCIYVFGDNILGSSKLGLLCFISIIISDFVSYLVFSILNVSTIEQYSTESSQLKFGRTTLNTLTDIIISSMYAVINICSFITIFMIIANVIKKTFLFYGYESILLYFFVSLFEITSGLENLTALSYGLKFLLGNALVAFCGISAIAQVVNVCNEYNLHTNILVKSKILSLFIVPVLSFALFFLLSL